MNGIKSRYIAISIGIFFVLVNLIGLDRSPIVWADEATINDPARELAWHGDFRSVVFSHVPGFAHGFYWVPPAQPLLSAAVYRFFAYGIYQTRIVPLLFGGLLAVVLFHLTLLLTEGDRVAAALAAILAVCSPPFLQCARSGRMDAQVIFFAMLAVFFCVLALQPKAGRWAWQAGAAGLCFGVAGMTHPTAIFWAGGTAMFVLVAAQRRALPILLLMIVFALIPAGGWGIYALHDLHAFQMQFLQHAGGKLDHISLAARMLAEAKSYLGAFRTMPLVLPVYLAGVALLFRSNALPRGLRQLALAMSFFLIFPTALLRLESSVFQYVHPLVLLSIPSAVVLSKMWSRRSGEKFPGGILPARIACAVVLLSFFAGGLGLRSFILATQWSQRGYDQVSTPIARLIPRGSHVCGIPEAWYAVNWAGSYLEGIVPAEADAAPYDFVICKPIDSPPPGRFEKIATIGQPLPPLLGRIRLESQDYQMEIWRAQRPLAVSK